MEFDGAIVFAGAIESLVPIVLAFFFFVFFIGLAGAIASLFMASLPPIESFVSMVFAGAMLLLGAIVLFGVMVSAANAVLAASVTPSARIASV